MIFYIRIIDKEFVFIDIVGKNRYSQIIIM
jgi:hypothetical protein